MCGLREVVHASFFFSFNDLNPYQSTSISFNPLELISIHSSSFNQQHIIDK